MQFTEHGNSPGMDADKRPVLVWPAATRPFPAVKISIVLCSVPCGYHYMWDVKIWFKPMEDRAFWRACLPWTQFIIIVLNIYTVCSHVDGSFLFFFFLVLSLRIHTFSCSKYWKTQKETRVSGNDVSFTVNGSDWELQLKVKRRSK